MLKNVSATLEKNKMYVIIRIVYNNRKVLRAEQAAATQ